MLEDFYIEKKKHIQTVKIDKAGQLSFLLSDWDKENIAKLIIIGEMNG